jgi:hypothetical protein
MIYLKDIKEWENEESASNKEESRYYFKEGIYISVVKAVNDLIIIFKAIKATYRY